MCKKEGPTNEERAALLGFPEPDYTGEFGGRCWNVTNAVKLWAHPCAPEVDYAISGQLHVELTRDQALAVARGLKPEPPRDLKLAQRQVARLVERQMNAHGVEFFDENGTPTGCIIDDEILMDIAAQVVQALDVLGREVNDE